MSSKSMLKAIKAHLDSGDYQKAADQAGGLVKEDRSNYTAFLFLGVAHEKLGALDKAQTALESATKLKPQDAQAYKGLVNLYEQQVPSKLDQYHEVVQQLATIYADHEDREQCQNAIDKYETFVKKHGSPSQYRRALELLLPDSPLYGTLEGRVLQPALVYQRILESAEAEEKEWINTQIGARRGRIGTTLDQINQDVKREATFKFDIESKYTSLIDWTQNDELRHELEQKRFQRAFDTLLLLPTEQKPMQRDKVLNMANGMVIIKQQYAPAWQVALEWVDGEDLQDWDPNIFRQYIDYFPDDGLSKVLRGFLDSGASPFPHEESPSGDQDEESVEVKLSEAEQLILMNEGLEDCPNSLLAHRIMAHTYLYLEEYESTTTVARKAQSLHLVSEKNYALDLQNSVDGVNLTLANALIQHQSPRHHSEAKALFQSILARKPKLTAALLGVGLIFEEDEDYSEAVKFLQQAAQRDSENLKIRLELAWCRALDHDLNTGLGQLEGILGLVDGEKEVNLSMKSEVLYRMAYCKWHIDTTAAARKDKSGAYKYLIESIKTNPNYAPAYTLLGIYFHDYGKSKPRARVAFQKAFELSMSELVAAERLAKMFANSKEWDLVELVAKRVVGSGKAKPAPGSKKKALSWPYAAMGVVEMSKQQYARSIVSFQGALRINPNDYHSWVGLGESYHNSGRYIAASRAFARAESIDHGLSDDQTWFAKYMLANVQKEIGAFDLAIAAYEAVLAIKQDEYGVLIAMLQSIAENAWAKIAQGMLGEASKLANKAISVAQQIALQQVNVFNLWKAVGDACSALGHVKSFAGEADLDALAALLATEVNDDLLLLSDLDKTSIDYIKSSNTSAPSGSAADKFLVAALLAYKRGIQTSSHYIHAQAVSWYNLGWAEHRAYISTGPSLQTKTKKPPRRFLLAAMKCFKRAIELEASNADFWNALGVVTMTTNARVSQHSFVRSLHLNEHSARTWTNLGTLYMLNNDNDLAYDAFTRAQSTDPEYAEAWVGQGLLTLLEGKPDPARAHFQHAFEIADSSLLSTKRNYVASAFDHLLSRPFSAAVDFLQPLYAARQLHHLSPHTTSVAHLLALFSERVHDYPAAATALIQVCDAVELDYESSESTESLARYAQAKADLARVQLAFGEYASAIENAETALDLSGEDDLGPAYDLARRKCRLSAHATAGLAHSHLKAVDQSIKMFQNALAEKPGDEGVVCMLAQVLWAKGGQAEREAARNQLLACVEKGEGGWMPSCLLAVMGMLDGEAELLEAVQEDLRGALMGDRVGDAEKLSLGRVLQAVNEYQRLQDGEDTVKAEKLVADATANIMLSPGQVGGWMELAKVVAAPAKGEVEEGVYPAEMAKTIALRQIPPGGTLEAGDVAEVFAGTGRKEDMVQAKMLAPWMSEVDSLTH